MLRFARWKVASIVAMTLVAVLIIVPSLLSPASREAYLRVLAASPEADGVIFGCTEIGMLLDASACGTPVFDNLRLHVAAALDFALGAPSP